MTGRREVGIDEMVTDLSHIFEIEPNVLKGYLMDMNGIIPDTRYLYCLAHACVHFKNRREVFMLVNSIVMNKTHSTTSAAIADFAKAVIARRKALRVLLETEELKRIHWARPIVLSREEMRGRVVPVKVTSAFVS